MHIYLNCWADIYSNGNKLFKFKEWIKTAPDI